MSKKLPDKIISEIGLDSDISYQIDVTDLYHKYTRQFSISSFEGISNELGELILKTLINDFRKGVISPDELSALCHFYFGEYVQEIKAKKYKKFFDISILLADLSFEIRVNPVSAGEWLEEALEFADDTKKKKEY
jgi:hypothetical protein